MHEDRVHASGGSHLMEVLKGSTRGRSVHFLQQQIAKGDMLIMPSNDWNSGAAAERTSSEQARRPVDEDPHHAQQRRTRTAQAQSAEESLCKTRGIPPSGRFAGAEM